jgi:hypothetical protein
VKDGVFATLQKQLTKTVHKAVTTTQLDNFE